MNSSELSRATVSVNPQSGEAWWWLGGLATIKLAAKHTEGRFSLIEMVWPPALEVPLHVHTREDELFFLQEGQISFWVGKSLFQASPGHTLLAPKNIPHKFVVTSAEPARYLIVYSPAGFEGFIRDTSQPAQRLNLPPAPSAPPDASSLFKGSLR